jgi:hypothetical protein
LDFGSWGYPFEPIYLGHCDEHSAAGKKRHEFNEHRTSSVAHVLTFTSAMCIVDREED